MNHFTSIKDVPNLQNLLQSAFEVKRSPFADTNLGFGRTLGLIFFNPSLRTRLSTQKAAQNLGLNAIVLNINEDGWKIETEDGVIMDGDKAEHIKDAAAVIGGYCDIIGIRSFATFKDRAKDYQDFVQSQFQKYAGVPIVSLESATRHPLQSFADLITIEEHKTTAKPKVVLTWAPHPKALPQAVANSFTEWMKVADVDLTITHPKGYELASEFSDGVKVEYDQTKAFEGADFVYAKNWSSYSDYGKVLHKELDWTVSADKMALTNNAKFMHCLPVRRNVVVADDVIDSANSLVLEQAKNRVVSVQTVLKGMLEGMI